MTEPRSEGREPVAGSDARYVATNLLGLIVQATGPAYHALIARASGVGGYGVFSWSGGLVEALSFFVQFGMDLGVRRAVSQALEADRAEQLHVIVGNALRTVVLAGLALGILVFFAAPAIAAWQQQPQLIVPLRVLAWGPLFNHIGTVFLCASQARLRMRLAVWARSVLQPIALFTGLGLAAWLRPGAAAASAAILCASVVTSTFVLATHGGVVNRRAVLKVMLGGPVDTALLRYGRQLVVSGSALVVLTRLDLLVLGRYADARNVGILAACLVFASGVSQLRGALDVPFIALLSRALVDKDHDTVQLLLRRFTRWALLLAVPVGVVFGGLGDHVLSLLGRDFAVGAAALGFLLLGQLCAAAAISGHYVALIGRVFEVALVAACAASIELGLLVWLAPRHGFLGAAIASATGVALNALTLLALAAHRSKTRPIDRYALQAVIAGLAAVIVAHWLGHKANWTLALRIASALACSGVLYVIVVVALGLHPEDRALLRRVLKSRS